MKFSFQRSLYVVVAALLLLLLLDFIFLSMHVKFYCNCYARIFAASLAVFIFNKFKSLYMRVLCALIMRAERERDRATENERDKVKNAPHTAPRNLFAIHTMSRGVKRATERERER